MTTPDPRLPPAELVELLACPRCRGRLEACSDDRLRCIACGTVYPVRDEIAVLLAEAGSPATANG